MEIIKETKKTNKPVYLSIGGTPFDVIQRGLSILGKENTTLLYCVVDYPSRTHALINIPNLRKKYNINVGYSDHSIDIYEAPMSAMRHGATVLEKHFKIRDFNSNDNAHALNLIETMAMIDHLKSQSQEYKTYQEINNNYSITRRCVATKLIKIGEKLVYNENYGFYRGSPDIHSTVRNPQDPNGKIALRVLYKGDEIPRRAYK